MKIVTTNITSGQIFFILFVFLLGSLISFYLGARFGPDILDMESAQNLEEVILPEDDIAKEIEDMLSRQNHKLLAFEALQDDKPDLLVTNSEVKTTPSTPVREKEKKKIEESVKKTLPVPTQKIPPQEEKVRTTKIGGLTVKMAPPTVIDVTEPKFSLQIGSYSDREQAEKALNLWQQRGFRVKLVTAQIPDKGLWYRLRLGAFQTQEEALEAQRDVMKRYRQSGQVVGLK